MQRILVPTDFSPHAQAALERAVELARHFHASIDLLHAYDLGFVVAYPEPMVMPPEVIESIRSGAQAQLDRVADVVRKAGLPCETHLVPGPAVGAIVELAEQVHTDLIAVGTRGLSGLKHVLLGSVAERTMRMAPCPVMTVHASEQPRPTSGTVIVPVDLSPLSQHAVHYAAGFAPLALGKARLVLAHAHYLPPEVELHALQHGGPLMEALSGAAAAQLESMVAELQDTDVECEYIARPGKPEVLVSDLVAERGADYVVMLTHGRTGLAHVALGSVAERIARRVPCPVISLKPPKS